MTEYMVISVTEKMIEYFQNDSQRINHSLKVFNFAQIIAEDLALDNETKEIIFYSALLHDIGIKKAEKKYKSSAGNFQEIESPKVAGEILSNLNVPDETINRVCFIAGNHHSYDRIDGTDFQIVVEADFLVNIFEEDMDIKTIKSINKRIFKTEPGKKLLKTMYLN